MNLRECIKELESRQENVRKLCEGKVMTADYAKGIETIDYVLEILERLETIKIMEIPEEAKSLAKEQLFALGQANILARLI